MAEDNKKEDKEIVKEGFLSSEEFQKRYSTTYVQLHPESFLKELNEEDREIYEDVEVLIGRNSIGRFNKFNIVAHSNKGKHYNTLRFRLDTELKKWIDGKLSRGELEGLWDKIFEDAKDGNSKLAQMVVERLYGKVKEQIEITGELDLSFDYEADKIFDSEEDKEDGERI